ncbi:DUF1697 domain-containing protein (plasmid) [Haloferax sp. S1W]|uniref:DUF1697 domain-containing protein n=1 Tax=Haloferax sp. S1W TaxID=3377110 RepID=UPI0037C52924
MTTFVAFLRGINVGAHNRMKMATLQGTCESLGLEDGQPDIQNRNGGFENSGNTITSNNRIKRLMDER